MDQLVNEIDQKAKEIERIENENYSIDPTGLEEFERLGIFREFDRLLGTVNQDAGLLEGQHPDYWPEAGMLYEGR